MTMLLNNITREGPENISPVVDGQDPVLAIHVTRLGTYGLSVAFITGNYRQCLSSLNSADQQPGIRECLMSKDYITRAGMYDMLLTPASIFGLVWLV
jgi:hypothetical protein